MTQWEDRQLCPDGACVGVIGPDGQCTVCKRVAPGWGDERQRGLLPPEQAEAATEENLVRNAAPAAPDDWDDRQLCPDGGCVGVIGADGRCGVCGRTAEVAQPTG